MFSLSFSAKMPNITGTTGVYFCTRDALTDISVIDSLKVGDINVVGGINLYDSILVAKYKDSRWHQIARHCFVLKAAEVGGIEGMPKDILALRLVSTLGCSPVGVNTMECGNENYENLNNVTVSCISLIQEGMKIRRSNLTVPVSKQDVSDVWAELYTEFNKYEKANPVYDRFKNNCCSACLTSLRAVRDSNSTDFNIDLSVINVRDFNFLGCGIKFDPKAESSLDYAEGSCRFLSDIVTSPFKKIFFVKRKQFVMPTPAPTLTPTPTLTGGDEPEEKEL
jgi:hypothetical protein